MNKLLIICGPTATGKTSLAIYLSRVLGGEIVSSDSRQVYKGLDIGTGKDIPKGSKFIIPNEKWNKMNYGYYEMDSVKIWGYDLVSPKDEFSVAQYTNFARELIKVIHKKNKLPILVGGTGLYIKSVVDGIPTARIPKSDDLRKNLGKKTTGQLYESLAQLDTVKAASLNTSDRKNPRRLIRAIEVATWKLNYGEIKNEKDVKKYDTLFVGLEAPKSELFGRIKKRIDKRVVMGIYVEIQQLLKSGVTWSHQSMSSLGYRQIKACIDGKGTFNEALVKWISQEKHYAKRQLTWFKREKRINWFNITKPDLVKKVENLVKRWYKRGYAKEN